MNFDFLDSEEFYNLMQEYRHTPLSSQVFTFNAFEKVKEYIKLEIFKQTIEVGESLNKRKLVDTN